MRAVAGFCAYYGLYSPDGSRPSGAGGDCSFTGSVDDSAFLGTFTPKLIRGYESFLMDSGKSPVTVNLYLSALSSLGDFLVGKSVIAFNPMHRIVRPKKEKRLPFFFSRDRMEAYFSSEEYRNAFRSEGGDPGEDGSCTRNRLLKEYAECRDRMLVSMLYSTGIRRSEACSLNLSSVDLGRRVLRVCGKGDKTREIPLIISLIEEISLYLNKRKRCFGQEPDSPFFLTDSGNRMYPAFVNRTVGKELKVSDGFTGKRSPHVLRHTFATHLLNDGAGLASIKEVLGHSSLAATQVYTHNSFEQLKKVYLTAHPRAKKGGSMEIRVQSVKFDADQKLLDFIDKKIGRLEKFYEGRVSAEVILTLLPEHENKNVKVRFFVPGNEVVVERNAATFEDAVVDCADVLKDQIVKEKEKKRGM